MWPWLVGAVTALLFLYFRSKVHTEEDAKLPEDKEPGFGPKITLSEAARGYFSHSVSWLLLVAWVIVFFVRIYVGQWSIYDLGVIAVICASWPLQEWFVHAHLEHLKPVKFMGRTFEFMITKTHRAHHSNPWDPRFGLTPPFILVLYFFGLPLFSYLTLPNKALAITATATTLALILNYEWIHYLIHTSYPPKTKFYRRLWKNHRLHHFKNEEYWFGLTAISGDSIMGTNPPLKSTPHSPTCLTLDPRQAEADI